MSALLPPSRDVNRTQRSFLVVLAVVLVVDAAIAATASVIQASGFIGALRVTLGLTGILFLMVAAFFSGSYRSIVPVGDSAMFRPPPSVRDPVLRAWRNEGLAFSDLSVVGMIDGGILTAIAFLLYLVPGA